MIKGNDIDLKNIFMENENVRKSELTREKRLPIIMEGN